VPVKGTAARGAIAGEAVLSAKELIATMAFAKPRGVFLDEARKANDLAVIKHLAGKILKAAILGRPPIQVGSHQRKRDVNKFDHDEKRKTLRAGPPPRHATEVALCCPQMEDRLEALVVVSCRTARVRE
jgi:hypothetical protein